MSYGITKTDCGCYETLYRGRVYTLVKTSGTWSMWNKVVGGRSNPPKVFNNLREVEAAYKHWKGIGVLVGEDGMVDRH